METATIKRRMKFTQTGNGPGLILIGRRPRDWEQSVDILSQYYTVIIPTISSETLNGMEEPDPVHYIKLIADELGVNKFSVMSDGFGAWTVFDLIRKYPDSIANFIVSGLPATLDVIQKRIDDPSLETAAVKSKQEVGNVVFWDALILRQIGELMKSVWSSSNNSRGLWILDEHERQKARISGIPSSMGINMDYKLVRDKGGEVMRVNPLYFTLIVKSYLEDRFNS